MKPRGVSILTAYGCICIVNKSQVNESQVRRVYRKHIRLLLQDALLGVHSTDLGLTDLGLKIYFKSKKGFSKYFQLRRANP
jgi:hypothetical protein